MARAQKLSRWDRFVGDAAAAAGTAVRWLGQSASELIGLPSALLLSWGLGEIYAPLFPIAVGVFGLAIARHLR